VIRYRIVPDGLRAFGVEVILPGHFFSARGFATLDDAKVWIIEQDMAAARREAAAALRVPPALELILRNKALRTQAKQARYRAIRLCSPSLVSRVTPDMDQTGADELIRRNRPLLERARDVRDQAHEAARSAEYALALAMEARRRRRSQREAWERALTAALPDR
jgi:hypothetical protein